MTTAKTKISDRILNEYDYVAELTASVENPRIRHRVENLLFWYVRQARLNKYSYLSLSILVLLCNAAIPILNLSGAATPRVVLVSSLAALSGLITSILVLTSQHDNWNRYRFFSEKLKRECVLYVNKVGAYAQSDADQVFLEMMESIAVEEVDKWDAINSDQK